MTTRNDDNTTPKKKNNINNKQQQHAAPYGNCLLARDNPENRKQWGDDFPFGSEAIATDPFSCTTDCPHYHYLQDAEISGAHGESTTTPIHILIASYRDRLCPRTLHNAFSHAMNPMRLYIRIIDQTQPDSDLIDDAGCWTRYCEDYNPTNCHIYQHQVQTVYINAQEALGPTDARSKLSELIQWDYLHRNSSSSTDDLIELYPVQLNDFCMQIDSHMDFADHFDTELISMFHRTRNDYAVLSTYVAPMEQNNKDVPNVPHLCMVTFTSSIRNWGTKECRHLMAPKLTNAMWGAGLSFHRCHAELNVPVDPYLDGVFDGEEGSRGIRFFTHGYDVYTPDRVLVTHDYDGHQHNPVVHTWGKTKKNTNQDMANGWRWNEPMEAVRNSLKTFGTPRVNKLLGIGEKDNLSPAEMEEIEQIRRSRYGIGNKRTLEQARLFTGIDLKHKRMVENKCGNLKWVPFEESPNYGVDEALARPYAAEFNVIDVDNVMRSKPSFPKGLHQQERVLFPKKTTTTTTTTAAVHSTTSSSIEIVIAGGILVSLFATRISRRRKKGERHNN